eukprot:scaffold8597_cov174-Skeletonema_dohrnii-CCMP3373.AAC.3
MVHIQSQTTTTGNFSRQRPRSLLLILLLAAGFTFPRFFHDPPPKLEVGSGPDAAAAITVAVVKPPAPAEAKTTVAATTTTSITTTTAQNSVAQISWKCTNDSELRRKIESSDNVIIAMPAKAAGTSNIYDRKNMKEILTHSWDMPRIIPAHFWIPEHLSKLLRNASRKTLIIYSHRDESSRFNSAVKHVLNQWCKGDANPPIPEPRSKFFNKIDGDNCYLDENKLIDKVLQPHRFEMHFSTNRILTCQSYHSIEEYAPNMIFVDYSNASKIQELLSEKYCPNMKSTFEITTPKTYQIYITREEDGESVSLSDWMDRKMPFLEWTLQLNDQASCLVKTRQMEDELDSCEGGFLDAKSVPK